MLPAGANVRNVSNFLAAELKGGQDLYGALAKRGITDPYTQNKFLEALKNAGLLTDDLLRGDIRDDKIQIQLIEALDPLFKRLGVTAGTDQTGGAGVLNMESIAAMRAGSEAENVPFSIAVDREVSKEEPKLGATTSAEEREEIANKLIPGNDQPKAGLMANQQEVISDAEADAAGKAIIQSVIHFDELYEVGTFKNLRGKGAVISRIRRMLRPILEAEEYEAIHDTNKFMNNLADYIYDRFEEKSLGPPIK